MTQIAEKIVQEAITKLCATERSLRQKAEHLSACDQESLANQHDSEADACVIYSGQLIAVMEIMAGFDLTPDLPMPRSQPLSLVVNNSQPKA